MSFVIKDDYVLDKYNEIWDKIKEILSIKFHSTSINYVEKENKHYTWIAYITIDSVVRMEKKKSDMEYGIRVKSLS